MVGRRTTGLIQRRDSHRDHAVAEGDQDETAEELRKELPPDRLSPGSTGAHANVPDPLHSSGLCRCFRHLHLPLSNFRFQKVRLRGGWIAVLAYRTSAGDSAGSPAARCSGATNAPRTCCVKSDKARGPGAAARAVSWARRRRRRADEARARDRPRRRSETGRRGRRTELGSHSGGPGRAPIGRRGRWRSDTPVATAAAPGTGGRSAGEPRCSGAAGPRRALSS